MQTIRILGEVGCRRDAGDDAGAVSSIDDEHCRYRMTESRFGFVLIGLTVIPGV